MQTMKKSESKRLFARVSGYGERELLREAAAIRDDGFGDVITFSPKVFIPLTELCRDVCHYCTFAKAPRRTDAPYLSLDKVLTIARAGAAAGCKEALFTLGDRPETRYKAAREWLAGNHYRSTLEYVEAAAGAVLSETGLLPHVNAGLMSEREYRAVRRVSPSMGIMLESISERLCRRGMPHFGSPDKLPSARLASIDAAGRAKVPLTSGILVGIGETREERLQSLLALRELNARHGHIQEIIVQNFRPKPGTRMAEREAAPFEELLWTVAVARLCFGPEMSIQAPPNLSPGRLGDLVRAGINDWGGVSPVTRDHVNPEAPWPALDDLRSQTEAAGKLLVSRLTVYPRFISDRAEWLHPDLHAAVLRSCDAQGWMRTDQWAAGRGDVPPRLTRRSAAVLQSGNRTLDGLLDRAERGRRIGLQEATRLLSARGGAMNDVLSAADSIRRAVNGDEVSYVVNRNINYTNLCTYKCSFCAFSKGKTSPELRGRPYLVPLTEIVRRSREAWDRGATEVCMQGGIHPSFSGKTYLAICRAVKQALPEIHIHAFSPLEVVHGARTTGRSVEDYLMELRDAGLSTLPGTAAELLDDAMRAVLCPDKLTSGEWVAVVEAAHRVGLKTTSTMMFGHVDHPRHWAAHLLTLRDLQERTGGITEFVPLPFVHMEAPLFRRGRARPGPTFREVVLVHAVARMTLHPLIRNVQASWTKLGKHGVAQCLEAGANDLGGTLMNESISRAAGAVIGEELPPSEMEEFIASVDRRPRQRNTLYGNVLPERYAASFDAGPMAPPGFGDPMAVGALSGSN